MIYYNRIAAPEGIDVNKSNESETCDICQYWYFLDKGFRFKTYVCNGLHDLLMVFMSLDDVAILNISGVDHRCIIRGINKSEDVNLLQFILI